MADPSSTAPVRPSSRQSSSATTTDTSAIYYDISPTTVLAVRLFNVLVLLMVAIAFILTLVQSQQNQAYYLLACNLIISSFVGLVVNYWYRSGDLGVEKYWYIILVGVVIIIQTVTTDIFVFRPPQTDDLIISTARPIINGSTTPVTPVTISNRTTNRSLLAYTTPRSLPIHVF